ncbi:MAG: AsmA-like C-terminal region-containing protein [Verrucomicrobiae bacterium]
MRVHPAIHFLGKNAIRLVLTLIFLGIPSAALYLREVGIGFGAKEVLSAALSTNALEVSIGRLALDPFSGLLARDISIRDRAVGGRLIAKISDVSLSLNLSGLSHGKVAVDKLSLADAEVSIPVDNTRGAPRLDLMQVNAEVILLGDRLRLSRFEGIVEGIRVDLTGEFLNPSSFQPASKPAAAGDPDLAKKLLGELAKLRFPGGPPVLGAVIQVDLADLDSFRVDGLHLKSGEVRSGGWSLKSFELQGGFQGGILRIQRLAATDKTGSIEVSAEWSRGSGVLEGAVLSTLSPAPFLAMAMKKSDALRALDFKRPPQFDVRFTIGTSSANPSISVTGALAAPSVSFQGIAFRDAGCQFAWKDGVLYARDIRVSAGKGELSGELWVAPDDFRINARTTIPPTALLGLFDPNTREFLSKMEFAERPEVSVSLRGAKLDFASLRGRGHLKLGRTAMRGSWLDSAEADFEIGDRCVTYRNFLVATGSGRGTGSFAYDVGLQEARLQDIRSTLVPYDVLMWIDPKIAEAVKPYRFHTPPSAVVQGKVHLKDATKNGLKIGIESADGLDYDLLKRTLKFGKTSAKVDVVGTKVYADIRRSTLMGGDVALRAIVSIDDKDPTFSADVKLSRVNFAKLTNLYFSYDDSKGVMSGSYKFSARMGQENLMHGSGSIRVEDGNVFAIPVLGPFSEILRGILPGVGYQTARVATADFTAANEIINTKNLVIEGAGFSMHGAGDIYFMSSQLDMSMRINARGIPGIVFYPVSKLFEYISTGTVAKPAWQPRIIPRLKKPTASKPQQTTSPP